MMRGLNIEIATLVETLLDRNSRILLILGSRSGALFRRNQGLADSLKGYVPPSFFQKEDKESFSECYRLLKEAIGKTDYILLRIELEKQIKDLTHETYDEFLADLVKQRLFRMILSFNPDDLLVEALKAVGLKEGAAMPQEAGIDFIQEDPNTPYGKSELLERLRITYFQRRNICQIVRLYKDLETFVHYLNDQKKQEEIRSFIQELLERLSIKKVLIVGMDLEWDYLLLSALPKEIEVVYFVSEDEQVMDGFHKHYAIAGPNHLECHYLSGWPGEYQRFLTALHQHIHHGTLPLHYGLMKTLQDEIALLKEIVIKEKR